jgi:hypothetical protein
MNFTRRFGCFLTIIGIILFIVYLASDLTHNPQFNLFFFSLVFLALGISLMRKGRTPPTPSNRFSLIRRLRAGRRGDEANNEENS